MSDYKVIGIDLAKRKFHFAAINSENKVVLKKAMNRKDFFENVPIMFLDCEEIKQLITREQNLEKEISTKNQASEKAKILSTIPGIGPINASILSIKEVNLYSSAKDFAASLGIVPKQNTTGGKIILGRITKQGDRYARTMLIQTGRSLLMRSYKTNQISGALSEFIERLKEKGKSFNVIAVAIANKLARIAYACLVKNRNYQLV